MALTRDEVRAVLKQLVGEPCLMGLLLHGAGLRLLECARLRVKDVDFASNQIVVRDGKGHKDRVTRESYCLEGPQYSQQNGRIGAWQGRRESFLKWR